MKVNYDTGFARGAVDFGNMSGKFRSFTYPKEIYILADRNEDETYVGVNLVISKEELDSLISVLRKAREDLATLKDIERIEND